MLQLISLVMLAYSYLLIRTNLPSLPQRIPTHFNAAGVADGWGSPNTLWVLLAAQALTCAVFLIVPYLSQLTPGAVHFGSCRLTDFPPAQRPRLLAMLNDMAGYLGIVMNLFFIFMLHQVIRAVAQPIPQIHLLWPLVLVVGGTFGIVMYYFRQFWRATKGEGDRKPPSALTS